MASFNPQDINVDIQPTTKFSEYRNKIQQSLIEFSNNINTELTSMFGVLSTETTYTQAQIDAEVQSVRDEMKGSVGRIKSPILDLPLTHSLDMEQGYGNVDFSRSTTATYIDRYGVLQYADINEPRLEKDGLLIEGSSTNLYPYSEDYLSWSPIRVTKGVDGTLAPDAVKDAIKITYSDDSGIEGYVESNVPITSGTDDYTISVFIKKGTADNVRIFNYILGGTGVNNNVVFDFNNPPSEDIAEPLADGWYRVKLTATDNNSGNNVVRWRVALQEGYGAVLNDTVYVAFPQIEKRQFASSYIPTTGTTVTRGENQTYFNAKENIPDLSKGGTIHTEFVLHGGVDNLPRLFSINFSDSQDIRPYFNVDSGTLAIYAIDKDSNALSIIAANGISLETKYKLIFVFKEDGNLDTYVNGVLTDMVVTGFFANMDCSKMTDFVLGRRSVGVTASGDANITFKNFKIYDKALTATEVALLGGN